MKGVGGGGGGGEGSGVTKPQNFKCSKWSETRRKCVFVSEGIGGVGGGSGDTRRGRRVDIGGV